MPLTSAQRLGYFLWAATRGPGARSSNCPGCGSVLTHLVRRKRFVTALRECSECGLRFRVPKDSPSAAEAFYRGKYREGLTTECPSADELARLLKTGFAGSEKDFSHYIEVLRAAGARPGDSLLDFGASWGYGSWQFRQAGYHVLSHEINTSCAAYARDRLGCELVDDPARLRGSVRWFFSAHVLEHLPDPGLLWRSAAAALSPDGAAVCFCPNGESARESAVGTLHYDACWGKVHPLAITARFLAFASMRHGFRAEVYSSPYVLAAVRARSPGGDLNGEELCLVSRRLRDP